MEGWGVIKSVDYGKTWASISKGLPDKQVCWKYIYGEFLTAGLEIWKVIDKKIVNVRFSRLIRKKRQKCINKIKEYRKKATV